MSLRRQFALALLAFSLLLTAMGGWVAWRIAGSALEDEMDDKLRQVAGAAAAVGFERSSYGAFLPGDESLTLWRSANSQLANLESYVAAAWILRAGDFTALVTSRPASEIPIGTPLSNFEAYRDEIEQAASSGLATTSSLFEVGDEQYKYGFVTIGQGRDVILAVQMSAGYLQPLSILRSRIFQASVGASVLAVLLAVVLAGNVVVPLERLSRAALRIQRGRWSEPVDEERGDEIGRLSRAMERMRIGILRRDEQLRLMLAQVAHEIRNPLGGLELFASAAQESDDDSERERILGRIRDEVETLNGIINDFLAFARPPDPNMKLHDVREPISEAAELVTMEACKTGKCVEVDLPDEPLVARADPAHVKRVTLNLLRNAAQAGNTIHLRAKGHRGEILLTVADDGPGIPEDLRDRIFEPFVTDKEQGAGLGLAIVEKVVEANGGRVELAWDGEDRLGSGAEFRVYFPSSHELPPSPRLPETDLQA